MDDFVDGFEDDFANNFENDFMEAKRVNITDDYMFSYVMRQPGVCRRVLECLLPDISIAKVQFKDEPSDAETQKVIQGIPGGHDVRLDVYLADGNTVYNVEMQTGNKHDLPKRLRYYAGCIDCDQLGKGMNYTQLRPTYVIFICTFDPFGLDQIHYSFENCCTEVEGLKLKDESYKLFFNVTGHKGNISPELRALLDYFMNPEHMPEAEKTALVQDIDHLVVYANKNKEWRRGYMSFAQAQIDAELRGEAKGKAEGKAEGILEMIRASLKQGFMTLKQACQISGMNEHELEQRLKGLSC